MTYSEPFNDLNTITRKRKRLDAMQWSMAILLLISLACGITLAVISDNSEYAKFKAQEITDSLRFEEDMEERVFLSTDVQINSWEQDFEKGVAVFDVDANGYRWKVKYSAKREWFWRYGWKYDTHIQCK